MGEAPLFKLLEVKFYFYLIITHCHHYIIILLTEK